MALRSPVQQFHDSRRRWLTQAGALASSTALPLWVPRAAAESQSTLNALPRIALIIGNTKYPDAPLKNPGNDATAIAGELQKVGFKVNLQLDTGRIQLANAIEAFGADLAKTKGVGLFYYAGHGAQLGWRNYLIPVDADVEKLEDMRTKTVELNSLLAGLTKAQNAMNVIILDACRDNPFGTKVPTEQKGLSQFDAPPGSLLAYATSPGNTAGDGEGSNGLYTENLLREIKVPEAKIEDVMKRVRLNVRRKSEGQQIPWESTSLEEDFYFLPPQQIKKLSESELEKRFNEELAIWEKIKESKEPAPLLEYLEKYPSGKFSELVQFQLDRVLKAQGEKKIEVVSVAENPFSKGTAKADASYKIGDAYQFRVIDMFTKLESQRVETVTAVANSEVTFNNGERIIDSVGNDIKSPVARFLSPAQLYAADYSIGKKWGTRFRWRTSNFGDVTGELELKVVGRESITVPAGTFQAFKVEGKGYTPGNGAQWTHNYWIAPDICRRPIVVEHVRRAGGGKYFAADRTELTSYRQA